MSDSQSINGGLISAMYVRPTGVAATDTANIQTALNAQAGAGEVVLMGGQFEINAPLIVPSNTKLRGIGALLHSIMASNDGVTNSVLYAAVAYNTALVALGGTVAVGAMSFTVSDATGWVASSAGVDKFCLIAATNTFLTRTYKVLNVVGTTITVERPIDIPFTAATSKACMITPPRGIHISDLEIRGSGDRCIEMATVWETVIERIRATSEATSGGSGWTGFGISFDVGSHRGAFRDIYLDGGLTTIYGVALESCTECTLDNIHVRRNIAASGASFYAYESAYCAWKSCRGEDGLYGFYIDSYDNTLPGLYVGSHDCVIDSCVIEGNSGIAFNIQDNATQCEFINCSAIYSGSIGFHVGNGLYSAHAKAIRFTDCKATNCTGNGINIDTLVSNTWIDGLTAVNCGGAGVYNAGLLTRLTNADIRECGPAGTANPNNCSIYMAGSNTTMWMDNINIVRTDTDGAGNAYAFQIDATGASAEAYISNAYVLMNSSAHANVRSAVIVNGNCLLELYNFTMDPASTNVWIGINTAAGSTLRANGRINFNAFAGTPWTINGYLDSGTVQLNGASAVSVAWPRLTYNDMVLLTLKTSGGTRGKVPVVAVSNGVGFSVTGDALDTSTYKYKVVGCAQGN